MRIRRLAEDRNIKIVKLQPAQPELEDVFVATLETVGEGEQP